MRRKKKKNQADSPLTDRKDQPGDSASHYILLTADPKTALKSIQNASIRSNLLGK